MKDCIFDKIIKGQIPAVKVWENDELLAFLTVAPINPGHTLLIPKKHIDYFFDLDDEMMCKLMVATKPLAKAIKKAFNPKTGKVGVIIAGMGVPHVHVHLVPMDNEGDLTFSRARHDIPMEEIKKNAEKIREQLVEI